MGKRGIVGVSSIGNGPFSSSLSDVKYFFKLVFELHKILGFITQLIAIKHGFRNRSQQASAPSSSPLSTTPLAPPRSHSWCDWGQSFKYLILRWIILLSFLIVLVEKYCYQNERAFRRWSCGQFLRDFNLLMIS